jgi:hypothetical protein
VGVAITGNYRPAMIPASGLPGPADGATLVPNTVDVLYVRGQHRHEDLRLSVHEDAEGNALAAYVLYGTLDMRTGTSFTVDPGVVVKFADSARLYVRGDASVVGTASQPIVFTSDDDDSWGGDTNLNGFATRPNPGNWANVVFTGGTDLDTTIHHARFYYGGTSDESLLYLSTRQFDLADVEVAYSSRHGLRLDSGAGTIVRADVFGNAYDGVYVRSGHPLDLADSRIYANRDDGIEFYYAAAGTIRNTQFLGNLDQAVSNNSTAVDAAGNWWGAADGPSGAHAGSGDPITAGVDLGLLGDDYLTSGPRYAYIDLGPNDTRGDLGTFEVLRGIDSSQFGTDATKRFLYDPDRVQLRVSGLTGATRLDLVGTFFNGDSVASPGNLQHVEDDAGVTIFPTITPPSGTARPMRVAVPPSSFADEELRLDAVRDNGFRSTWSELWVLEADDANDVVDPVVTITAPTDGDRVPADVFVVRGTASDDVELRRVEVGIDVGAGPVWSPVTTRQLDGLWEYRWEPGADGTRTITARATDAYGNVAESAPVTVTVDGLAPGAPTRTAAWDTPGDTGGSLTLGWLLSADDGAGAGDVTGYRIERSGNAGVSWEIVATVAAGTDTWVDVAATDGTAWRYRVVAVDAAGNETTGAPTSDVLPIDNGAAADLTPPEDVTNVAGSPGSGFVRVTWTPSADTAGDLVDYLVDVSADGGASWGITGPAYDDGGFDVVRKGDSARVISGLTNDNGYRFRVRARDAAGNVSTGVLTDLVTPSNTAYTSVSGTLSGQVVWSGGVYVVTGDITVPSGARLTILPGVVVKMGSGRRIRVDGELNAVGTEAEPIVVTAFGDDDWGGDSNNDGPSSGTRGYWTRITLEDSASDDSVLQHVKLLYGGGDGNGALYLYRNNGTLMDAEVAYSSSIGVRVRETSSALLQRVHLHDNNTHGLYGDYGVTVVRDALIEGNGAQAVVSRRGAAFQIHDTQILDNEGRGVDYDSGPSAARMERVTIAGNPEPGRFPFHTLPSIGDGSDLSGNDDDRIDVRASTTIADMTLDPTPLYRFFGGTSRVGTGYTLRLQPGTVFKSDSGTRLEIDGALVAVGTEAEPIVLTSTADDSIRGSVDGTPSAGARGNWNGIYIDDPSIDFLTRLEHVHIRYAGQSNASLDIHRANPYLTHLRVEDGNHHGVYAAWASPTLVDSVVQRHRYTAVSLYESDSLLEGNTLRDCDDHGVYSRYGEPTVVDNVITDNDDWGVYHYDNRNVPPLVGNVITGNQRAAMLPVPGLPSPEDGNILVPNDREGIWVRSGTRYEDLRLAVETDGLGSFQRTYRFDDNFVIDPAATVTIDPGVILKWASGGRMYVRGGLDAVGTEDEPIVFTSVADDAVGGDIDLDGASAPTPGAWEGVHVENYATQLPVTLEHVDLRYGGTSLQGIVHIDTRVVSLRSVTASRSATSGIYAYRGSATFEDVSAFLNTTDGIRLSTSGTHDVTGGRFFGNLRRGLDYGSGTHGTVTGAQIFGNAEYGITGSNTIAAAGNWWGSSDGPSGEGPGSGDAIDADVDITSLGFDDFLADGSEHAYVDLGGTDAASYGVSLPVVSGTPSTEWGTGPNDSFVFDADTRQVTAEWSGLSPISSYRLFVTVHNEDSGTNTLRIEDVDGELLLSERAVPSSRWTTLGVPVPRTSFDDGSLDLVFSAPQGTRVAIAALWLVEARTTDANPPVVTLDEPLEDAIVGAEGIVVRGVASDGEGPVERVEVGFTLDGTETWTPVTNLAPDGI